MSDLTSKDEGLPAGLKMMAVFGVIMAVLVVIAALLYMRFKKLHDPVYLYSAAETAYSDGRLEDAEEAVNEELSLLPDDQEALKLKAAILKDEGRLDEAAALYERLIETSPEETAFWQSLLAIAEEKGDTEEMEAILGRMSDDMLAVFEGYLPSDPVIMTEEGTYSELISVELSGRETDRLVYTTDGSDPTENSQVYTAPIRLQEGRNEIRAAAFSEKGIRSRVITGIYEITLPLPDPPEILPESGSYEQGSVITVTLPADAVVYYSFDGVPTPDSAVYSGPVAMPEGSHIFSAIVVDQAGKTSAPSSQTYVVQ